MPKQITLEQQLQKMRDEWDERARENARFHVATAQADWDDDAYFASGEDNVFHTVSTDPGNVYRGQDPKTMRVLEIGCGTGRITRALANLFGEVHAVDVSGEMIAQARIGLAGHPNAHVYQNNGCDLSVVPPLEFDFAYSFIVFQHIPSYEVIESYVREVHRLLKPGGLFKFQVQGYVEEPPPAAAAQDTPDAPAPQIAPVPEDVDAAQAAHEAKALIDNIKPDDTWLGVTFSEALARKMAERCGFEMRYGVGAGEQYYWLWFFKP
ncbi:MAG: class I SAM-dependent methyltransferase [Acidobacteriota bacterium]